MTGAKSIEAGAPPRGQVDEELLALPVPDRRRRMTTLTVMALAVAAALGLAWSLRLDAAYFFASSAPVDLGEARSLGAADLETNRYVTVSGTPMAAYAIEYERLIGGERYGVFPLAGQRRLFVQVPLDAPGVGRTAAERTFSGRLVTFGELGGRVGALQHHLREQMDVPVGGDTYLVMADDAPGSYVWALALLARCLAFALLDAWLLLRWFRPIRLEEEAGDGLAAA